MTLNNNPIILRSSCVVEHTCAYLGIQNHTESGEHGRGCFGPFLSGRNWLILVIFSSIQTRPWSFRARPCHSTMDG